MSLGVSLGRKKPELLGVGKRQVSNFAKSGDVGYERQAGVAGRRIGFYAPAKRVQTIDACWDRIVKNNKCNCCIGYYYGRVFPWPGFLEDRVFGSGGISAALMHPTIAPHQIDV